MCAQFKGRETVVKEVDTELFEVGVGKMGGEGFEEIIVGGTTTKEAKVKRAFFKHRRVDASMRKRVKKSGGHLIRMSLKSRYLLRAFLSVHLISRSLIILKFNLKQQILGFSHQQQCSSPWKHALKPGSGRGRVVDQLKRKRVESVHTGKGKEGFLG